MKQVLESGDDPQRGSGGVQEARGGGPRMTPVFKKRGFLTRASGETVRLPGHHGPRGLQP